MSKRLKMQWQPPMRILELFKILSMTSSQIQVASISITKFITNHLMLYLRDSMQKEEQLHGFHYHRFDKRGQAALDLRCLSTKCIIRPSIIRNPTLRPNS